ncbi:MAG: hypothetical protein M1833_006571 [Piccolia ochrophora]|nr:MAG: hypothetical protein M1833_006571 [Piccolia ochrophora]
MAAVSPKVLKWLHSVLTPEYYDVDRTYNDVARTLSRYPSLSPRTDVYTYETGVSVLLLNVSGTLPVSFRGTVYRFPVSIWIPYAYPRAAPLVYVTPTQDMMIRPGQHVGGEGMVYHPYLAGWGEFWDKSSLLDCLSVLSDVFAKEPPLISTQSLRRNQQQAPGASTPPPLPPLPQELNQSSNSSAQRSLASDARSGPPPPPPKQHDNRTPAIGASLVSQIARDGDLPPPVPPLSGHSMHTTSSSNPHMMDGQSIAPRDSSHAWPQRLQSLRQTTNPPAPIHFSSEIREHSQASAHYSPVSPVSPPSQHSHQFPPSHLQHPFPPTQDSRPHAGPQHVSNSHGHSYPQAYDPRRDQATPYHPTQPAPKPRPQPTEDLLSSPLTLTTLSTPASSLPAPPIPPNPEKDALLSALAGTLSSHRQQSLAQAESTLPSLAAQHTALVQATRGLEAEMRALESLDATLTANDRILADCARRADEVMDDARTRRPPAVDDLLVAPTVVGKQLYDVVADERAVADALFVLAKALDRGRVGVDVFLKQTRGLARERFLKKALVRKISRGMGLLDEQQQRRHSYHYSPFHNSPLSAFRSNSLSTPLSLVLPASCLRRASLSASPSPNTPATAPPTAPPTRSATPPPKSLNWPAASCASPSSRCSLPLRRSPPAPTAPPSVSLADPAVCFHDPRVRSDESLVAPEGPTVNGPAFPVVCERSERASPAARRDSPWDFCLVRDWD